MLLEQKKFQDQYFRLMNQNITKENTGWLPIDNRKLAKAFPKVWAAFCQLAEAFQIDIQETGSTLLINTDKKSGYKTVARILGPCVGLVDGQLSIKWGKIIKPLNTLTFKTAENEKTPLTFMKWGGPFHFTEKTVKGKPRLELIANQYTKDVGLPAPIGLDVRAYRAEGDDNFDLPALTEAFNEGEDLGAYFATLSSGAGVLEKMVKVLAPKTTYKVLKIGVNQYQTKEGKPFSTHWFEVEGVNKRIQESGAWMKENLPWVLSCATKDAQKLDPKASAIEEMVVNWTLTIFDMDETNKGDKYYHYMVDRPEVSDIGLFDDDGGDDEDLVVLKFLNGTADPETSSNNGNAQMLKGSNTTTGVSEKIEGEIPF